MNEEENVDERINNNNIATARNNNETQLPNEDTLSSTNSIEMGFNCLKRILFQKLLIFYTLRLIIYLNKLYQDVNTVNEYYSNIEINFLIISVFSLILPPIVYTFYLIGANLAKDDHLDGTEIGTKTINGFLLIPWQIKRHLDMLHFSAQRACQCRKADPNEKSNIYLLERNAEVLEFFEDFYSGFLQIILQLYLIFVTTSFNDKQGLTKPIYWQLFASILSVKSMMIACRRRDDGPLTSILSFFGWLCIFTSRVTVISLVTTYIRSWIFVLCLIHVLIFSIWIYNIAIESYQVSSSSRIEARQQFTSRRKRASIATLVFLLFGIPSLIYWPIMFQLKEGRRPLIFLLVITVENVCLLFIWTLCHFISIGTSITDSSIITVSIVVVTTLVGVFFLIVYILCKPKYTDQVVLYEIRESRSSNAPSLYKAENSATKYGLYYAFCDIVFRLPTTNKFRAVLPELRQAEGSF